MEASNHQEVLLELWWMIWIWPLFEGKVEVTASTEVCGVPWLVFQNEICPGSCKNIIDPSVDAISSLSRSYVPQLFIFLLFAEWNEKLVCQFANRNLKEEKD